MTYQTTLKPYCIGKELEDKINKEFELWIKNPVSDPLDLKDSIISIIRTTFNL